MTSAVDRAERRVLSRFGAFVRRTAKQSIRRRKRVSQPGKPPSSHSGELKRMIFFAYDPIDRDVVVGPVRVVTTAGGKGNRNRRSLGTLGDVRTVPALLETGGRVQRRTKSGTRTLTYRPRPYMMPAFQKELAKMPDMLEDSVRR